MEGGRYSDGARRWPAIPSVRFFARQTTSKGGASEERETGADMLFVLDIRTDYYVQQKGVLVQAKRLVRGKKLPTAKAQLLRAQCSKMLDQSAASFVFLYAPDGMTVISATVVEGSTRNDLHALEQYRDTTLIFFSDFLLCWIGDPRLKATDKQSLAVLRALSEGETRCLSGQPKGT